MSIKEKDWFSLLIFHCLTPLLLLWSPRQQMKHCKVFNGLLNGQLYTFYDKFCQLYSWLHSFLKMTKNNESKFFLPGSFEIIIRAIIKSVVDLELSPALLWASMWPWVNEATYLSLCALICMKGRIAGPMLLQRELFRGRWREGVFREGAPGCSQSLRWGRYVRICFITHL